MAVIGMLRRDHRVVERPGRDDHAAVSAVQRRALTESVLRELSRRPVLEEATVQPLAGRSLPDAGREIDEHPAERVRFRTLDALVRTLDQAQRTAPTRPHRNAPDQPPALTVAGPTAAAHDRVRDRLQRRPRT